MTIRSDETRSAPAPAGDGPPPLSPGISSVHTVVAEENQPERNGHGQNGHRSDEVDDRYPWIAMGVILVGTFMVILDTTIVNVALPQIGIALHDQKNIEWVVTAYLLAVGVGLPATGWLADRYGRKQIFTLSLAIFTLSSLAAALSPNLSVLVAIRVVQGLGGGALMPVGLAMIYELFPPDRRGAALGVWGVAAMAGPAFGPVIGGYLVTAFSWHWLFLVNVPIGVVGVTLALRLLRDTGYREARPFDGPGMALASTGLVVWLFAFSSADDWGWASLKMAVAFVVGLVLLGLFVRRELRLQYPLIELRMFKVGVFRLTIAIVWLVVIAQYSRAVFLPLELETLRDMTALQVGVLFVPAAAAAAVTFFFGGRITDRIGPRPPVMAGAVLLTVGSSILGTINTSTSLAVIVGALVISGFGTGFALIPLTVTGMNSLPGKFVAQASAVRTLNQRVAASFGIAVLASIVATQMGVVSATGHLSSSQLATAQHAYNSVFFIGAGGTLIALVMAWFLPNREENAALHADRAAEEVAPIPVD